MYQYSVLDTILLVLTVAMHRDYSMHCYIISNHCDFWKIRNHNDLQKSKFSSRPDLECVSRVVCLCHLSVFQFQKCLYFWNSDLAVWTQVWEWYIFLYITSGIIIIIVNLNFKSKLILWNFSLSRLYMYIVCVCVKWKICLVLFRLYLFINYKLVYPLLPRSHWTYKWKFVFYLFYIKFH